MITIFQVKTTFHESFIIQRRKQTFIFKLICKQNIGASVSVLDKFGQVTMDLDQKQLICCIGIMC